MTQNPKNDGRPSLPWPVLLKRILVFWKLRRLGWLSDPFYDRALRMNPAYQRVREGAATMPVRKVLVAAVDVPSRRAGLDKVFADLSSSRHEVTFVRASMAERGKFDNINPAIANVALNQFDWFIVVDDDIELPEHFLDEFLYVSEKKNLVLSQPAHKVNSHKTWSITRRTWANLVRTTHYVETGPVTAFHKTLFADVVPFPESRYGWGMDYLWAEAAWKRNLNVGIVDATPIRHTRPVAGSYNWTVAETELERLLASKGVTRDRREYMSTTGEFRSLD